MDEQFRYYQFTGQESGDGCYRVNVDSGLVEFRSVTSTIVPSVLFKTERAILNDEDHVKVDQKRWDSAGMLPVDGAVS